MKVKRKVNRVGRDTLTISLPKDWTKNNFITKGMDLEIEERTDSLIIKSSKEVKKNYHLSLNNLNTFILDKLINELYIQNIDYIIINLDKYKLFDYEMQREIDAIYYITELVNDYIGLEVISQDKDKIIIQSLIKESSIKEIDLVKQRTCSLLKELWYSLIGEVNDGFKKSDESLKSQIKSIRRFIYYYVRLVVGSEKNMVSKLKIFTLYDHLDNSLYKLERVYLTLKKSQSISTKLKNIIQQVGKLFCDYLELDEIKSPTDKVSKLIKERFELIKNISKLNLSKEEQEIIRELRVFINLHNDILRTYLSTKV